MDRIADIYYDPFILQEKYPHESDHATSLPSYIRRAVGSRSGRISIYPCSFTTVPEGQNIVWYNWVDANGVEQIFKDHIPPGNYSPIHELIKALNDVEAFKGDSGVELSVLSVCGTLLQHWVLKPPYAIEELSTSARKKADYIVNNLHDIPWDSGDVNYSLLESLISSATTRAETVYVKGTEKKNFLAKYTSTPIVDLYDRAGEATRHHRYFPLDKVDAKRVIVGMSVKNTFTHYVQIEKCGVNCAVFNRTGWQELGSYKSVISKFFTNMQPPQKITLTYHEISLKRMCGDRMVVISEKQDAGIRQIAYLAPSWARLCDVWDLIDVADDRRDMWSTPVARYCNDLIGTLVVGPQCRDYSDPPGVWHTETLCLTLYADKHGYGFTVHASPSSIFISDIRRDSPADSCTFMCEPRLVRQSQLTENRGCELFRTVTVTDTQLPRNEKKCVDINYIQLDNIANEDVALSQVCELLKVFRDCTEGMSSETQVTLYTIILISQALKKWSTDLMCGCLQVGDRLLTLNNQSLQSTESVTQLLSECEGTHITLMVEFNVADSVVPASGIFLVKLANRGNGLGITVTASKNRLPGEALQISEIRKGSVAHRTGTLKVGDHLLAIDNQRLDHCSLEDTQHILQSSSDIVTLRIQKQETVTDTQSDSTVVYTVELEKYGGPIGITITGSEEMFEPITISGVTPGRFTSQPHETCVYTIQVQGHSQKKLSVSAATKLTIVNR
uniref:PDZ domain-containing protein n=1 Tax=Timema douglasi TaxID=61478 RepID=A0A7R8VLB7_TIMDO|nr:unnamed protein product [Timema douglasi]